MIPMTPHSNIDNKHQLMKTPEYFRIRELIEKTQKTLIGDALPGNCISTAQVFQSLLSEIGINSMIVEVQLVITRNGEQREFLFVGYDNGAFAGQIDTHVVLITSTPQPMLIDLSLGHVLPRDQNYVLDILDTQKNESVLAEYHIQNLHLVYSKKTVPRLSTIHDKTLVQRIMDDITLRRDLRTIRTVVFIAIGIGITNFSLNMILIILKAIFP